MGMFKEKFPFSDAEYAVGGHDGGTGPGNAASNKGRGKGELRNIFQELGLSAPKPDFLRARVLNSVTEAVVVLRRQKFPCVIWQDQTYAGRMVNIGAGSLIGLSGVFMVFDDGLKGLAGATLIIAGGIYSGRHFANNVERIGQESKRAI